MSSIVEQELVRGYLWNQMISELANLTRIVNTKAELNLLHLVLSFRFSLRQLKGDDPIFVSLNDTKLADESVLESHGWGTSLLCDKNLFLQRLKAKWQECAEKVKNTPVPKDEPVKREGGFLTYKGMKYQDLRDLGAINPAKALALQYRYDYLNLGNQGLARQYTDNKKQYTEAFASSFNRYFDTYCSAFPDLESEFGSIGSFFDVEKFTTQGVHINPPFMAAICNSVVDKIIKMIDNGATNTFIFTLPHWQDFEAITKLKASKYYRGESCHTKGSLKFIDYLNPATKPIAPCDIIEITLSRQG